MPKKKHREGNLGDLQAEKVVCYNPLVEEVVVVRKGCWSVLSIL